MKTGKTKTQKIQALIPVSTRKKFMAIAAANPNETATNTLVRIIREEFEKHMNEG